LAQAITTSDEPFVLLQSPKPAPELDKWLINDDLNSVLGDRELLKQRFLLNVNSGVFGDKLVAGAQLLTFTALHDVKLSYNRVLHWSMKSEDNSCGITTFNGRVFGFYDKSAYEPFENDITGLVHFAGGMGNFVHQSMLAYPAGIWREMGARFKESNPTAIRR
jgi:hypothetical protein